MVKIAALICCALLIASPALACGVLETAEPRVGSIVGPTNRVMLTFSEAVVPGASGVTITNAAGNEIKTGHSVSSEDDTVLTLKTAHPLAHDIYKIHWDVLWRDCNSKTQGNYKFTVK